MENQLYKVVKVMRKTGNKKVLEKNLSREQAQRLVQSYPDSQNSMVIFTAQ